MLKTRIIPVLLWKSHGLVKGESFQSWRRIGTLLPAVKIYNTRDVDELVLLDITATNEGREPDFDMVSEIASEMRVPLCVGGGVDSLKSIELLLRAGADKVILNSIAYSKPDFISEASSRFGSQCVVVAIDAQAIDGSYLCFSHSGQKPTQKPVASWAAEVQQLGAGEILLTSILADGTMKGYDIDLIKSVTAVADVPVIAAGGAGTYDDMYQAIEVGGASAIAASAMFHFTEQTPLGAKKYLSQRGLHMRNIF